MARYKVQAPDGSIITIEGPEGASQDQIVQQAQALYKKPEAPKAPEKTAGDYVKEFGQSAASLADTVLGAPAALGQQLGYGVGRAFGLSPEEATRSSMKVTEPFMIPVGSAFGVTNTPAYQNEASKRIMQGVQENVVQPLAKATGLPEQDVGSMVGSATMAAGPLMGRAGSAVGRGVYAAEPYIAGAAKLPVEAVKAPVNFLKGAYEGVTKPVYNEATSAMVPLREQYTPVPAAQRFMGEMPGVPAQTLEQLQTQTRPTSELITSPIDRFAKATAPVAPTGEPLVPLQGRGMEAWGERVGRGIRTNPGQALAEVAITGLTGIPVKTISQGVSELAARRLASKTGFSPEFPKAVQAAEGRAGIQANMPTQQALPYTPQQGPVNPATLYGGPGGQVGTSPMAVQQAELATKYAPQPVAPVAPTGTPAQVSQQMAAQKLTQNVQPNITKDQLLAQIRARNNPQPTQPTVQPVVPEGMPQLPSNRWTPEERLQVERERLKQQPQTEMTSQDVTQMKKEIKSVEMSPQQRGDIIKKWVDGERVVQGNTIDVSKGAYNNSNRTRAQAERLLKAGIDEIPTIQGATESQIIDAMHGYIEANKPEMFKAKRGPKKKGPDVSKMLTEDDLGPKSYSSKEQFEKERMVSMLKEIPHEGSYPQGDKIIHVEAIKYGNLPKDITSTWEQTKMFATDKSGKRVPIGKEWTEADPEPLTSQLKRKLKRD